MITNLVLIQEIAKQYDTQLVLVFVDMEKAFDSVSQSDIMELMISKNVPLKLVRIFAEIYGRNEANLAINGNRIGQILI